jgi:hypothetical protein
MKNMDCNTNNAYYNFVSILNYGDKPNVLFNTTKSELMITMKQNGNFVDSSNNILELDTNGNRIIYVKENFLLQELDKALAIVALRFIRYDLIFEV